MDFPYPPAHAKVLIVGGGPAGAYAAAALALEGINVVVLEASKFPRYHIGESMLPSMAHFLRFIGAEEKLRNHGFCVKKGAAVKLNQYKREAYTDFTLNNPNNASWNVIRSEFDNMLLLHARECGALVFEDRKVLEIESATTGSPNTFCPKAATFLEPSSSSVRRITFDWLVDASGRSGILSTKYLHNRNMNQSLRNIACWGYWSGGQGSYMPGTSRENAPWFEALTDESGWAWFIPLNDGTVSVGVVADSETTRRKKIAGRAQSCSGEYSLLEYYYEQIDTFTPGLKALLGNASLRNNEVKSASDYSYSAERYAGDHWRLAGDASDQEFIWVRDKIQTFSLEIENVLALFGGLTAATSIAASIKSHCSESVAAEFHHLKVSSAYTRFLIVVMSAYKQIRAQSVNLLSDVDEDNFDRAFEILRPVIQGSADSANVTMKQKLTEDELQATLDFCKDMFAPTDHEVHGAVMDQLGPHFFSPDAPIYTAKEISVALETLGFDGASVVNRVNARKAVNDLLEGPKALQAQPSQGFVANIERGSLGLVHVGHK